MFASTWSHHLQTPYTPIFAVLQGALDIHAFHADSAAYLAHEQLENPNRGMSAFEELGVSPELITAVEELGWT